MPESDTIMNRAANADQLLTQIIPTRNRLPFLRRIINYYRSVGFQHRIIVADSSDFSLRPAIKQTIASLGTGNRIEHLEFNGETSINSKIQQVLQKIATPYVAICADDDFHVPEALNRAVVFLDNNKDHSAAHGDAALFILKDAGAYGDIDRLERYPQRSVDGSTGAERLLNHLCTYSTTWYSVQRTKRCIENHSKVVALGTNWRFGELIGSCLSVIQGKTMALDGLYMVRQAHDQQISSEVNSVDTENRSVFDWVCDSRWAHQYKIFHDCIVEELERQDGISPDEARQVVKQGLWSFLEQGLTQYWNVLYGQDDFKTRSVVRKFARRSKMTKNRWHQAVAIVNSFRSFLPGAEAEMSLHAFTRSKSSYNAAFAPIHRAISVTRVK